MRDDDAVRNRSRIKERLAGFGIGRTVELHEDAIPVLSRREMIDPRNLHLTMDALHISAGYNSHHL